MVSYRWSCQETRYRLNPLRTERGKLIAGYFSAKIRQRQSNWIPYETEALSIAVSNQHYSPYIIQSFEKPFVLTDSKPCIQAHNKLLKGQFSNSSRLSTFLSTNCRYTVKIQHLDGSANFPSETRLIVSNHPVKSVHSSTSSRRLESIPYLQKASSKVHQGCPLLPNQPGYPSNQNVQTPVAFTRICVKEHVHPKS